MKDAKQNNVHNNYKSHSKLPNTFSMGHGGSKKLTKDDLAFLIDNTEFSKDQIKAWYKGFMVGATSSSEIYIFFNPLPARSLFLERVNQ